MAVERVLLLIADIGGYTRFMKVHRLSLSHAQEVVGTLLESVIGAAGRPFEVAKLEGDAVFLFAKLPRNKEPDLDSFARKVRAIREAFLLRQRQLGVNRVCTCDACVQLDMLTLKFVAHLGEAGFQRIRRFVELAGVDVILVHRMLKNSVPVKEYVLMTDAVAERLTAPFKGVTKEMEEDFEGLGRLRTHYIDLNDQVVVNLPAIKPTMLRRWWQLFLFNLHSLPYLIGLKKPCAEFKHVDERVGGLFPDPGSQEALSEGVRQ